MQKTTAQTIAPRQDPTAASAPHPAPEPSSRPAEPTGIFGLRYIEEEAAEIRDVVGCLGALGTLTGCDDHDSIA